MPFRRQRRQECRAAAAPAAALLSILMVLQLEAWPRACPPPLLAAAPAAAGAILLCRLAARLCRAAATRPPLRALVQLWTLLDGGFFAHAFAHAAALLLPCRCAYGVALAAAAALFLLFRRPLPLLRGMLAAAALMLFILLSLFAAGDTPAAAPPSAPALSLFWALASLPALTGCDAPCGEDAYACRVCARTGAAVGLLLLLQSALVRTPLLSALCARGAAGFRLCAASLALFALNALHACAISFSSKLFTFNREM